MPPGLGNPGTTGGDRGLKLGTWPGVRCSKIPSLHLVCSLGWGVVAMTHMLQGGRGALHWGRQGPALPEPPLGFSGMGAHLHPQLHWDLLGLKGAEMEGT